MLSVQIQIYDKNNFIYIFITDSMFYHRNLNDIRILYYTMYYFIHIKSKLAKANYICNKILVILNLPFV